MLTYATHMVINASLMLTYAHIRKTSYASISHSLPVRYTNAVYTFVMDCHQKLCLSVKSEIFTCTTELLLLHTQKSFPI